jgi:ubiquitin-activating enzyme E1
MWVKTVLPSVTTGSRFKIDRFLISFQYFIIQINRLAELNSYVATNASMESLTEELLTQFTVIVLSNSNLEEQHRISKITRKHNIALIIASTPGLYAQVFTDFGTKFRVLDANGEMPLSTMISSVTQEEEAVVAAQDETRHGFEDGDYVVFSEVEGMTDLNGCKPMKIKVCCTRLLVLYCYIFIGHQ